MRIELSTAKREIRGNVGNHHGKQGLDRMSCASRLTIANTADTSPDLAGNNTQTRSCKPNQVSRTRDFSGRLVSSTSFSFSSPMSLFVIHKSTIASEHKLNSSLSITPGHHHKLTLSAAYTDHSIPRLLNHPNIDCLPLPGSIPSLGRPCCTQFSTFPQLQVNQWIESQLPSRLPPPLQIHDWPPPRTPPNLLNHGLIAHLQWGSITASQCISEFTQSWPPIASSNSLDHSLPVNHWCNSMSVSNSVSNIARSWPQSVSPTCLEDSLPVHLQTRSITASLCISESTEYRSPSVSLSSLHLGIKLHLQSCSIMASQCIPELTQYRPESASLNSLDHGLQWSCSGPPRFADNHHVLTVQIYRV